MTTSQRIPPAPVVSEETAEHWAAANEGRYRLRRCLDTGKAYFPPYERSPFTGSTRTEWFDASGKASLYAFSVLKRAEIPYCLAYVELEEGVIVMSNIVTDDFDSLRVGQPLRVSFADSTTEQKVPVFTPDD